MAIQKPKTAIIGSGISGMGVAYILSPHHNITVFEKNDRVGGHSRTIDVEVSNKTVPVDTGFIVFNKRNYPHLTALFEHLNVPYEKSDMSFGVSINNGELQYSSSNMLVQKRNILSLQFWKMLFDIIKFNKKSPSFLDRKIDFTLADCLNELNMGSWFRERYIKPMGSAIWSCSADDMLNFPAATFIRFFQNHGLLSITNRPQWYTVSGGSKSYIKKLTAGFQQRIKFNTPITEIKRIDGQWNVNGEIFDHVVFACHGDDSAKILQNNDHPALPILKQFTTQPNRVVVHTDPSFMPPIKKSWASWVYVSDDARTLSLSYWMNNLQNLKTDKPIIITLNPQTPPQNILDENIFKHPVFTKESVTAQGRIHNVQGVDNLWFCGAYQRYGFHEDGLLSAVNVAKKMGVKPQWM